MCSSDLGAVEFRVAEEPPAGATSYCRPRAPPRNRSTKRFVRSVDGEAAGQRSNALAIVVCPEFQQTFALSLCRQDLCGCDVDRIESADVDGEGAFRAVDHSAINWS